MKNAYSFLLGIGFSDGGEVYICAGEVLLR